MAIILPLGGGKGGSGKTFLVGSLAALLAREGFRTLAVDVDLGAANLHTILGVPHPRLSLSDFLNKRVSSLADTVVSTPAPLLFMISGAMNNLDIANLAHEQKMKVIRHLVKLPYDYILLDLGAGTSFNTLDFFLVSDYGVFVTTPEPTAIENIYRLIRAVYFRKIRKALDTHRFRNLAREAEERNPLAKVTNPDLLLAVIRDLDPERGEQLARELASFHFKLIVNQQRKQDNPHIGAMICKIISRHLDLKIDFLGNVAFDDRVHNAVCKAGLFIDLYPFTQTVHDLRQCLRNLLSLHAETDRCQRYGNG
ncbi:MAG: AAA family ATPase [Pseudomonadota bacterium]|nr:AAA family ATPase [Pseudomonadota bacterium]